jgi:hypothetical protein
MTDETSELIEDGLRAWVDGDLDALETMLDPRVTLRGVEPGPLDCIGRDQVMQLLRKRQPSGQRPLPGSIDRLDEHTFLISAAEPSSPATRITVLGGEVVQLQQFRSPSAARRGEDVHEEAAIDAIRAGDVGALNQILAHNPALASARLSNHGDRTLLHVATDWPGHFPNVVATINALIAAGADVNAPSIGDHTETPLHWAASSDDVEAIDALLDAGADIEAGGAVIGGGTPLSDATAFGQWNAARRLVERGAHPQLWEAAALGLMPQLSRYFTDAEPSLDDVTHSFWCACHGNQLDAAAYFFARGADINRVGYDNLTPLGAAQRSGATDLLRWLRAHGATSASDTPSGEGGLASALG